MKYTITIQLVTENQEIKYPDKETVYEQTVERSEGNDFVASVANLVNKNIHHG